MKQRNIPSEEELAQASAALRQRSRGLDEVREKVLSEFQSDERLHEFFIWDCSEMSFKAYIFYEKKSNIAEAEKDGLSSAIRNFIHDALEDVGRGSRDSLSVDFEFDSHENVVGNYEGDYYLRLR